MRLVLVSFTLVYNCIIFHYNVRHSTIDLSLLPSEENLIDSEPLDIFLLGTRAPRGRKLHEARVSFTLTLHMH